MSDKPRLTDPEVLQTIAETLIDGMSKKYPHLMDEFTFGLVVANSDEKMFSIGTSSQTAMVPTMDGFRGLTTDMEIEDVMRSVSTWLNVLHASKGLGDMLRDCLTRAKDDMESHLAPLLDEITSSNETTH